MTQTLLSKVDPIKQVKPEEMTCPQDSEGGREDADIFPSLAVLADGYVTFLDMPFQQPLCFSVTSATHC